MCELLINGRIVGVFSNDEKASEYANDNGYGTHSVMPFGTFLATDIEEAAEE